MTRDWKLTVKMTDFGTYADDGAKMDSLELELNRKFRTDVFSHDGKGTITSGVFEAKIQSDLPEWWEGFFPEQHEFEVTAAEEGGDYEIRWLLKGGACVSCTDCGEELVGDAEGGEEEAPDGDEDFSMNINGSWREIKFFAKEGTSPNEKGKYEDFIGEVDMSFFIEPDGGSFMGVYMSDLPDPDDDEYKHRLAEEVRRIRSDYLGPYLERGKKISIRQIDFTSANYEGEGLAPIKQELGCIIVLCEDDSSDADNGMRLYKNDDEDEYDEAEDYDDEEDEEDEEETEGALEKSDAGRNFEITDGVLKKYTGSDANVTIPKGVTEIGKRAFGDYFRDNTTLTSISIPDSVMKIGEEAFYGCPSLASVSIPGSVTEIGKNAFQGCKSLASVSIPGSVTEIGNWAFNRCTALSSVTIPGSVTEIGEGAFYGCTSLTEIHFAGSKEQWYAVKKGKDWRRYTPAESVQCADGGEELPQFDIKDGVLENYFGAATSVSIPEGVTEIGKEAFWGCKSLASVTIPDSVTKIGEGVFYDCTSLASVSIPDSVTEIGRGAFNSCESLASVSIPDSVTAIGEHAFQDCTSLESVTIPGSVTEIGKMAFYGCESLASVTIPTGVTEIGESAFDGCTSLAEIHYAGNKEQWYAIKKGEDWNKDVPSKDVLVRKE